MSVLGNILWFVFGGGLISILWCVVGLLCCCTIIGIPIGLQCFKIAGFICWPFGRDIYYSHHTIDFLGNIIWLVLAGWELTMFTILIGLIWCLTIVGIPFGMQYFKFAKLSLMPFGANVV